ncbi:TonB-dependent receptor domain-containing protein [Brevundimonas sp.]|uniref:TonB-dependent receptor n=1 Tax=Brevundimonas sp. TaxID=1871086 RepID=UPI0028A2724A|nr:TonB-dependent receptor [Brevundimonas sp.]
MTHRIIRLLAGTALAGFVLPAAAQSAAAVQLGADPAAQALPAQSPTTVGDIVVTANKREQRLQSVPATVSVVAGEQLTRQNVTEVTDLTRTTPALNIPGPFGALSIRGLGSATFSRSAEGSVGVVVDGVALANTSIFPPQLFDVARLEVLEGPQGMLFGRNASSGVLNIVTNRPSLEGYETILHADVADYGNYVARGVVNMPIDDTAALRVSGSWSRAPEFVKNLYDGSRTTTEGRSVRARLLWNPTTDLSVNLILDHSETEREGGAPWTVFYSTPGSLLTSRLETCGVAISPENLNACIDGGYATVAKTSGLSAQIDWSLGDFTLTSISAHRVASQTATGSDADSVPVDRLNVNVSPFDISNFSQEFRLTSPTGGFIDYVAGLYYFDSHLRGGNTQIGYLLGDLPTPYAPYPLGQTLRTTTDTTSYAIFGQATVNLTNALRLLLGARAGHEDVSATTYAGVADGAVGAFADTDSTYGRIEDDYFSYRLGAQYDLTDRAMSYLTYTEGYKGPAVNDQAASATAPLLVQPEIPHAWELGLKSTLFDGRLAANVAAYHTKVDNFQTQFFDPDLHLFVFGNAPELTSKGVSVNLFGQPLDGLNVNLGAIWNDATYGPGYLVTCSQGQTAAQGCLPVYDADGVQTGFADDAEGNRLIGAPEWKVTANMEYARSVGNGLEGYIQTDVVYTSTINFNAAYNPIATNEPATLVGGRIGVRSEDGRYGVSIFVRNLFDVYRPVFRTSTPTAAQQLDSQSYIQFSGSESRRLIGVSLDTRF